ncbi:16S rRNA (guanine(527)-N(7))-methyltransferase RsmG [Kaarinaea lacus]
MGLDSVLSTGLKQLGLDCSPVVQARLLAYVALLDKWNRVYNLTAVRDPGEMVTRHLLDSLAIHPFLQGSRILDVGTGAGLPGIPLAIVDNESHPRREYVLLDSNSKKTRFVQQVKTELGLDNVSVVHQRCEDYRPAALFDVVVSRAFASIADMLKNSAHHCAKNGVILAMKGADPVEELDDVPEGFALVSVTTLNVPGLGGQRHLVCIKPATQG